jgi:YHS domain-containing protein
MGFRKGRRSMNGPKVLAVLCFALALALLTVGCADCPVHRLLFGPDDKGGGCCPSASTPAAAAVGQKTCPVMAGEINADIFVDYEGRRVYFCCPACKDVFAKEPQKYLDKLDAGAAEGEG